MAPENSSASNSSTVDPSSEMYVHHNDPTNYNLTTQKLNGDNYTHWKSSAEISLIAKNKLGFVTGTCKKPSDDESLIAQWERSNNLVISWLIHSIEPDISNSVLYCKTAVEIWDELSDRFGQSNAPRIYQVQRELASASQGSSSISCYFTHLKTLWDEYLSKIEVPVCACGKSFVKLLQSQQVMQFLMGLNDDFKTARGSILMMHPLHNLSQVYRLILQEEKQRGCNNVTNILSDSAAFASYQIPIYGKNMNDRNYTGNSGFNRPEVVYGIAPNGKKSKFFCQHCKIWGHSIDRCFKVHGPTTGQNQNFKGKKIAGNVLSSVPDQNTEQFGPDQQSNEQSDSYTSMHNTGISMHTAGSVFTPPVLTYE